MITAQHLANIAYSYFVAYNRTPNITITPALADKFAWDVYRIILSIPSDPEAKNNLLSYIYNTITILGADPSQAIRYFSGNPEFLRAFIEYCKTHYRIETNAERLSRLVTDAFSWVGDTAAGALWGLLKPFIKIAAVIAGGYLLFTWANKKVKQ